jgi:hypothetical protein
MGRRSLFSSVRTRNGATEQNGILAPYSTPLSIPGKQTKTCGHQQASQGLVDERNMTVKVELLADVGVWFLFFLHNTETSPGINIRILLHFLLTLIFLKIMVLFIFL